MTFFLALAVSAATAAELVPAKTPAPQSPALAKTTPAVVAVPGAPAPAVEEPAAARPILMTKREITAQLQIFLDQQLFSPGMIDGNSGKFLAQALRRWQRARGLPETGQLDENVPFDKIWPVYTHHTVSQGDFKFLGELPGKPSEQAKKKYLPYSNYTEFVAERYHCSIRVSAEAQPAGEVRRSETRR
jgi:peptidoglycan hydrolase-like protein with peptidoglycan-binding domain